MRTLLFLACLLVVNLATSATGRAQHIHHSLIPASSNQPTEPNLGDYGYRHKEIHKRGIVSEILSILDSQCCDGGEGGECRVTKIRPNGHDKLEALLDGEWCPLGNALTTTDVNLGEDIEAVVCASKVRLFNQRTGRRDCPAAYCAAHKHPAGS